MAKNKPKQSSGKSISKQIPSTFIFYFSKENELTVLTKTIKSFYENLDKNDNFIILNRTEKNLKESNFIENTINIENLQIINSYPELEPKESALNNNLVFINLEKVKKEIAYTEIEKAKEIKEKDIAVFNYSGTQPEIKHAPVLVIKRELFLEYQENYKHQSDFNRVIDFLADRNFLDISYRSLHQKSDSLQEKKKKKPRIKSNANLWITWLVLQPLKEIKNKPKISFTDNSSIYRLTFVLLSFLSLLVMSIASFKAGISGDEPVNYKHAELVYNYYTEGDSAALNTPRTKLQYYGQSFDNLTFIINKIFKIENYYESRHLLNTITGWLTMLFASALIVYLAGWRAGLLTFLLIIFSPRFLGHSWNNPKDIPFALTYILSILYQIKLINELPKLKISTLILVAISIALSISVRIGGLLLIAYQFLFLGIYIIICRPFKNSENPINKLFKTGIILGAACVVGYFLGLILWPYALEAPFKNPIESLKVMTNFTAALKQTFMGKTIWSDNVPWNYVPVYILFTTPIIVFTGLFAFFILSWKKYNTKRYILMLFVAFAFIFPIFYIIYKSSNVYGGWRHVLFTYPALVAVSGIGLNNLINIFKDKLQPYLLLIILVLLAKPILHTFKNHPLQYVYFNQFVGGTNGAFGSYEMDYYYHSLKQGAEWLNENILENDTSKNIKVATNHGELVSYYLRDQKKAKVSYVRYYNRGNYDWDYAIIANSYINPYQQKKGYWPPENTIHTINVDDVPVCAILKREQKFDLLGYQKLRQKDYFGAIADLKQAIQKEKTNEVAYNNLATAYMYTRRFDLARQTINQLLEIYPKYDKALNLLGLTYLNERNYEEAYKIFTSITEMNPKFFSAYHNLGLVFMRMNKGDEAIKYFQQAIRIKRNYKPSYLAIAQILKQMGKDAEAQKYTDAANKLK